MTTEQKAMAYDEALKRAKESLNDGTITNNTISYIHFILPELKENEDEKIRKELIEALKRYNKRHVSNNNRHPYFEGIEVDKALAWLEKQKDREKLIKELSKYCAHHTQMDLQEFLDKQKPIEWKQNNVEELTDFENAMMHIGNSFFGAYAGLDPNNTETIKEQANLLLDLVNVEWSEEDKSMLYNIIEYGYLDAEDLDWLRGLPKRIQLRKNNVEWSEEDNVYLDDALWAMKLASTVAQDENDMGNIWCAERWLKSLKERIQPKQELSKKDENNILFLTSIIEECFKDKEKITLYGDTACANFTKENVIERLKSLRPQNTWKPTKAQIEAIEEAIEFLGCTKKVREDLKSLHKQLKKLREEKL